MPNIKSARYRRQILERIEMLHKKRLGDLSSHSENIEDLLYTYFMDAGISDEATSIIDKITDVLAKNFIAWAVPLLNNKILAVEDMEDYIHAQEIGVVRDMLWPILDDIWTPTYRGPIINLGAMSQHGQSVHIKEIENTTKTGIALLQKMNVPEGQKTLREIEEAFTIISHDSVSKVIADMKDWGKRDTVMSATENVYRTTLRGLWAKIKSSHTKKELIQRLYEECYESIGMCADGHVARLINVLVGFDDDFKSQVSPMEYFQNNIAKISENKAPLGFKIEQAKRLMDDIRMPEEERGVWLSALE